MSTSMGSGMTPTPAPSSSRTSNYYSSYTSVGPRFQQAHCRQMGA
jgi:hypothetical protein